MLLDRKLYVTGRFLSSGSPDKLYQSSYDLKSWTALTTPTYWFALATYLSRLVLVGGVDSATDEMTRKLWTSADGSEWREDHPPLPAPRASASAISVGDPECLVVAGGEKWQYQQCSLVEVLSEGRWSTVQPLPKRCYDLKLSSHRGVIYVMGGYGQDHTFFYWCKVKSLVRPKQMRDEKKVQIWNRYSLPVICSSAASFGGQLVVLGIAIGLNYTKVYAHDTPTESWVHVGKMPLDLRNTFSMRLSTGQLVVIGVDDDSQRNKVRKVFKASLRGESYVIITGADPAI